MYRVHDSSGRPVPRYAIVSCDGWTFAREASEATARRIAHAFDREFPEGFPFSVVDSRKRG